MTFGQLNIRFKKKISHAKKRIFHCFLFAFALEIPVSTEVYILEIPVSLLRCDEESRTSRLRTHSRAQVVSGETNTNKGN